ncbi:putative spermidine/putrescine transport system permease protein/spermidine/putrescine transport system permease protein [Ruegeria halocynthiae]|uniref:Putative spermidine/putrescine transport system permease protein/spermidine/putrescine transport system permease protein n=1 Tax=Ruegeria halocynthiae TaxID=985054 RepID=A0A1H2YIF5_9RHOB|nr:ABC transporter permease [Ruegeria halocynthiae]SDX04588.1 putative spermidine/putrescine transport system permease protein/spermidine/putrescine transport system permease protein [Ruegeria halocynthiae]
MSEQIISYPNQSALQVDERREDRRNLLLMAPALVMMTVVILVPIGWLFFMSFWGENGFTLEHYQRMSHPGYRLTFIRTFQISVLVTIMSVLLGYPVAYLMTKSSPRVASIIMMCVLLPFWTSILVRTYAWLILLQRRGIINGWLMDAELIDRPLRLVHNMTGTVIGMTHILLPFMILPLYSSMKAIDGDLLKAARNAGATPSQAFRQVFLPLSVPGLAAGIVVVFVLCLGFYITPEILGGGRIVMWSKQIQNAVTLHATWGPASALGVVLLVVTLGTLWIMTRIFRINRFLGGL